jgi:predicted membrane protein
MNTYSTPIKYGLLAGIIMIILVLLIYFIHSTSLASFTAMIVFVPLVFLMIWGGITFRKENGGFKSFGQAFMVVYVVSVTATFSSSIFGFVLYSVVDRDLAFKVQRETKESTLEWMEKLGASDEDIEKALQRLDDDFQVEEGDSGQLNSYLLRRTAMNFATTLVVGAIFSALIALFVSRGDEPPGVKAEP